MTNKIYAYYVTCSIQTVSKEIKDSFFITFFYTLSTFTRVQSACMEISNAYAYFFKEKIVSTTILEFTEIDLLNLILLPQTSCTHH